MEQREIIILGDGRDAVICAQSAKKKYSDKSVVILVPNYKCFVKNISSSFFFFIERDRDGDFHLFLDSNNIKVIVDEAVDRKGYKLHLKSGRIILFEKLIIAQGCKCPNLPIEGLDKEGIYFLKPNFDHLHDTRLLALKAERIVIYGGSYMGIKLADELLSLDKNVFLVEKSAWLLPETIDSSIGREVMVLLAGQGCKVILNFKVIQLILNI